MGSTRLLPFLFGVTCPLAAHIRKVNIRDSSSDMADQAKPVLILRGSTGMDCLSCDGFYWIMHLNLDITL
jgi:hypothetical protein